MLRQLMLQRKIASKRSELASLVTERDGLAEKRKALQTREAELEAAVNETNDETPQEDRDALDQMVAEYETEDGALRNDENANAESISELENEINGLEEELRGINEQLNGLPGDDNGPNAERENEREVKPMKRNLIRNPFFENTQERSAFFGREEVKGFLGEVRSAIREKRAISGVGLTIPTVMLDLIRVEVANTSKLMKYVRMKKISGKGRQPILGAIPEAIWTEAYASLNDLALVFNQVEVDEFKIGGYIPVPNAALEDSDEDLGEEVMLAIGAAIGKGVDKAILFGTGTKMPLGIAPRLAQTSQPGTWDTNGPAWTDLHSSNIQVINVNSSTGAAFFVALIDKLAIAKPKYSSEGLFWAVNRKTHLDIMAKALAFNAQAALLAGVNNQMPVVGGDIVEFEDGELADYEVIGGFGGNYLLGERKGMQLAGSDLPLFLRDQTVFKGTARYDGKPVAGEAFVIVNYNNTSATTEKTFPEDYANMDLNHLTVVAAKGTAPGDTVVTVSDTVDTNAPTLKYKVGQVDLKVGQKLPTGFNALTSGTTQITAAAGKTITVAELDAANRVISAGYVASNPKTT